MQQAAKERASVIGSGRRVNCSVPVAGWRVLEMLLRDSSNKVGEAAIAI